LYQADTVLAVTAGLVKAADLSAHFLGNTKTCGIVGSAVNAEAGRKPL